MYGKCRGLNMSTCTRAPRHDIFVFEITWLPLEYFTMFIEQYWLWWTHIIHCNLSIYLDNFPLIRASNWVDFILLVLISLDAGCIWPKADNKVTNKTIFAHDYVTSNGGTKPNRYFNSILREITYIYIYIYFTGRSIDELFHTLTIMNCKLFYNGFLRSKQSYFA